MFIEFLFKIYSCQGEHKARDKDGAQCEQNLPQAKRPHLGEEHIAGTGVWQNFFSQTHSFYFFSKSSFPILPHFSRWSRWKQSTSIFAPKSTFTRRSFVASQMSWTTHGKRKIKTNIIDINQRHVLYQKENLCSLYLFYGDISPNRKTFRYLQTPNRSHFFDGFNFLKNFQYRNDILPLFWATGKCPKLDILTNCANDLNIFPIQVLCVQDQRAT